MLDELIIALAPIVASGLVWLVNRGTTLIQEWPSWTKVGLYTLVTLGIRLGAEALGVTVPAGEVVAWVPAAWEGLLAGLAGALLYRIGQAGVSAAGVAIVCCAAAAATACTGANAMPRADLSVVQQGDSVGWVVAVTGGPPLDRRGNPVVSIVREVRAAGVDTLVRTSTTPAQQVADTLWEPAPLPGDSVRRFARAASIDDRGRQGSWSAPSGAITYTVPDTLGPVPPDITFDTTLAAAVLDSFRIRAGSPWRGLAYSGTAIVHCSGDCAGVSVTPWPTLAVRDTGGVTMSFAAADFAMAPRTAADMAARGLPVGLFTQGFAFLLQGQELSRFWPVQILPPPIHLASVVELR